MRPLKLTLSAFGPMQALPPCRWSNWQRRLYLVTGDTGAGKTTLFDAITYACTIIPAAACGWGHAPQQIRGPRHPHLCGAGI